ncbi:MAG: hypothetical protein WCB05_02425 [Candidatus Sulfotelmatobacter sp.]
MPKAAKKSVLSFKYSVNVEVRLPEFEPLDSLKWLDYDRLQKGRHKVEIGFVVGGCCRRLVKTLIRDGMVTGLEVERCKQSRPASSGIATILKEARRLMAQKYGKWKPIPVSRLAQISGIDIFVDGHCIVICAEPYFCIACCFDGVRFYCIDLDEIIR